MTDWTSETVGAHLGRPLVSARADESVQTVARRMTEAGVSCVPVIEDGRVIGMITDRDLRSRLVAVGHAPDLLAADILSADPVTIAASAPLFDAMAVMTVRNIHHLPVLDNDGQAVGVLTSTDLVRHQNHSPQLFSQRLWRAANTEELQTLCSELPNHVRSFMQHSPDAAVAGRLISALTDTLVHRLIQLYEDQHGGCGVAWAWLTFGSQGREDQTLYSDQDNGLLLADDAGSTDRQWAEGLAHAVCDGLAACGIPYCPGDIMATNPEWRTTRAGWYEHFRYWTESPTRENVMHSQIFFDSRCVAGDVALFRKHRSEVADLGKNPIFLAMLTEELSQARMAHVGRWLRRNRPIPVKSGAIAQLNSLVRIHALALGSEAAATPARLIDIEAGQGKSASDVANLNRAWHFLCGLRMRWQLGDRAGPDTANTFPGKWLTRFERASLRAALTEIEEARRGTRWRFRHTF